MKILITGASGFVGNVLLEKLNNDYLHALGRSLPNVLKKEQFFKHDIDEKGNYSEALHNVDVVIHLAARVHVMNDSTTNPIEEYRKVNTRGTENLAFQAAKAGVKRFIFVSSIKVNGESSLSGIPFKFSDESRPQDDYGLSKAEAEKKLLAIGKKMNMETVIIRPTLVYGPGVKGNFASLLSLVAKGIPLPFGCIKSNKRSLVSVENLVDLVIKCIEHPKAANQIFLVSDNHDVSTSEMIREMAIALGKTEWQLPLPVCCYAAAGKLFNKSDVVDRLTGSLQVDISHTKKTLGWVPPQSLKEGFKQTAEAFVRSKKSNGKA
ncbi:TPA: UDP-glucose 4-epimerase family protein [Vibrio parahaemolyticus]|uniref:UDP-glucose 4-epimerase family protein n=1 Tax=Vibrio parahaemolyticus TaxID=670 RepID=UPI001A8EFE44|nr:SDR family oxidoreductase [Vibrio parahaemolyticus]MBO0155864.1 SDR family oxidoreductase [Vibrio parahaemolyticus]MBO0171439.1 SDR family oxidoreductase [Vibrio parahaemolyticus]MCX8859912.1 SDR family oxidoreductase [Vibrio parahaemolyticus]MCX8865094.1 SDR family oxidoreductase [Vibrio parahaemolyticus]MCX8870219.1 SDR family oxidoreductase [Vibrio parahaemolyticus]